MLLAAMTCGIKQKRKPAKALLISAKAGWHPHPKLLWAAA
jgi:hypothetical protein